MIKDSIVILPHKGFMEQRVSACVGNESKSRVWSQDVQKIGVVDVEGLIFQAVHSRAGRNEDLSI